MAAERSGILVRPMLPADLPETIDVWVAAWQAAYPAIDFEARRGWTLDRINELERTGSVSIVALQGCRIVGALVVNPATGYLDQLERGAASERSIRRTLLRSPGSSRPAACRRRSTSAQSH